MKVLKTLKNRISEYKGLKLVVSLVIIFTILLVGVLLYRFATHSPAIANDVKLATSYQPETFTELYFDNHMVLPTVIDGGKIYGFSFTVHNVEAKDMEYSYIVYLQSDFQKVLLDQGNFTLKNDGIKTIQETFGPLKNIKMKVTVVLVNKNQQIDFLMTPNMKGAQ